jgi:putative sigma-54 modulation protein
LKVTLRGVHLTLTEAMKAYVLDHLVVPLERFCDEEAATLDVQLCDNNGPKGGQDKECRATAFLPGTAPLHVTEVTEDVYKSIDLARDRLERLAKREREKRRTPAGHAMYRPIGRLGAAIEARALEEGSQLKE